MTRAVVSRGGVWSAWSLLPLSDVWRGSKAGASSTHSIRFARFGSGYAGLGTGAPYPPSVRSCEKIEKIARTQKTFLGNQALRSENFRSFQFFHSFRPVTKQGPMLLTHNTQQFSSIYV